MEKIQPSPFTIRGHHLPDYATYSEEEDVENTAQIFEELHARTSRGKLTLEEEKELAYLRDLLRKASN